MCIRDSICQLQIKPKPDATTAQSIMHVLGTGQLRLDKPLPPKKPAKADAKKTAKANTQ